MHSDCANIEIDHIDLHMHTRFSDGACSVEDIVNLARAKELNIFAVTDHYSEFEPLAKRISKEQLNTYLDTLGGLKIIKGIEVDILSNGISISKRNASLCDLVLGGLHFFTR